MLKPTNVSTTTISQERTNARHQRSWHFSKIYSAESRHIHQRLASSVACAPVAPTFTSASNHTYISQSGLVLEPLNYSTSSSDCHYGGSLNSSVGAIRCANLKATATEWISQPLLFPVRPAVITTNTVVYPRNRSQGFETSQILQEGDQLLGDTTDAAADRALVCYGLIYNIEIKKPICLPVSDAHAFWDGHSQLKMPCGKVLDLSDWYIKILCFLAEDGGCSFDFVVSTVKNLAHRGSNSTHRGDPNRSLLVSIVLYGQRQFADEIGEWLISIDLYLQTPSYCSRNVPYCNPHALSNNPTQNLMTSELSKAKDYVLPQTGIDPASVCFDTFSTRKYDEAEHPILIKSPLHSHQLQALTFMQGRERGWDLHNELGGGDLWQCAPDSFGREKYVQQLSGESSYKPPTQFKGGVLADEMGLGKTCTMLALIASDLVNAASTSQTLLHRPRKQTLIVVPLPLLQVWEKQIAEHMNTSFINFITYHGPGAKLGATFDDLDIVLTTYNKVSQEWGASSSGAKSGLLNTLWHRIILDEAHIIKNKTRNVSKAVSALQADRRWCVTGTPIQNRLTDIYSLLRFLRCHPFDNWQVFEESFVDPWTLRADENALRKLQMLMLIITIRRPRATISLPERTESFCWVDFSLEERQLYDQSRSGAATSIDMAFSSSGSNSGMSYLNALQRINDLRYICNHGSLPQPKARTAASVDVEDEAIMISKALHAMFTEVDAGSICEDCGCDLFDIEQEKAELLQVPVSRKRTHRDHRSSNVCQRCLDQGQRDSSRTPPLLTPDASSLVSTPGNEVHSSKIQALVDAIAKIHRLDKCAVFSYWTTSLRSVGRALTETGIPYITYDGSMSRTKRDGVLQAFSNDPATKVILISISCGGQGLDLTAANHAYLLEPQWNPMLEEQAMARVHRLGQTKPVKLVRLLVRGTWEEKIVTLQARKRLLADLIVDNKGMEKGEEARKQLMWLKDLVS